MQRIYKAIAEEQKSVLSGLIGANFIAYDAALADNCNTAWNTVRLHTDRGSVDINCLLESIPINDDGDTDEFGIISIQWATDDKLVVDSISGPVTTTEVGKPIDEIIVVSGRVKSFYGSEALLDFTSTKAIVFKLGSGGYLVFDRELGFEEMLTIKAGALLDELIHDDSESWEIDSAEDTHTRFEHECSQTVLH